MTESEQWAVTKENRQGDRIRYMCETQSDAKNLAVSLWNTLSHSQKHACTIGFGILENAEAADANLMFAQYMDEIIIRYVQSKDLVAKAWTRQEAQEHMKAIFKKEFDSFDPKRYEVISLINNTSYPIFSDGTIDWT